MELPFGLRSYQNRDAALADEVYIGDQTVEFAQCRELVQDDANRHWQRWSGSAQT